MTWTRRRFMSNGAKASILCASASHLRAASTSCPFRLSVINDEISEDFDHACSVAANDFGLHWIELRGMWKKNITALNDQEIAESQRILKKYSLRVTDIASPLFKVDWPGAPRKNGQQRDEFHAHDTFAEQDALLEHCIGLAKTFGTDRIRCFDSGASRM